MVRNTTEIKATTPAMLAPITVAVFPSALEIIESDGDVGAAKIRRVASMLDVLEETDLFDEYIFVVHDVWRENSGNVVLFVILTYSVLVGFL